jgi:hypothetical protein
MAVIIDPGLLDYMAANAGACTFVLKDVPEEDALEGMRSARRVVGSIPHPEEPEDPLPSFMSTVEWTGDGARFWIDIADADGYGGLLERVLQAVLDGLAVAGVDGGLLTYPVLEGSVVPADPGMAGSRREELPPSPIPGTSWSVVGLPLPDPHRELWAGSSGTQQEAGFMFPHDTEFLLRYFELIPGTLLSYTATPPDDRPYASVYLVLGGRAFIVSIRDAGTERNVQMTVETNTAKVEADVLALRSAVIPPEVNVRVDRRSG